MSRNVKSNQNNLKDLQIMKKLERSGMNTLRTKGGVHENKNMSEERSSYDKNGRQK